MTRRNFIGSLLTLPLMDLYAKDKKKIIANIKIKGDLDDDLFIVKVNTEKAKMLVCQQMHNPKNFFDYRGTAVPSADIYGVIDYNEDHFIKEDEIVLIMLANEREEINDLPTLNSRTHFKAVDLYCNEKVVIPSLMPEFDDVPGYPVWFTEGETYCSVSAKKPKNYNYYKMWENAICGTAIIVPFFGEVEVFLFNKDDDITFKYNGIVTEEPQQLLSDATKKSSFPDDLLAESNGTVYDYTDDEKSDDEIRKLCAHKIMIKKDSMIFVSTFPYPMPYPNRIYIQGI